MLGLAVMLSVGMLQAAPNQPVFEGKVNDHQASSRGDAAARRLASEPLEVARTYETLLSTDKKDRMQAYGNLSDSMKSAIWTHRLLVALAEHPEFTEEQRTILYDAVDLFTPEFFAITFPAPDWSKRVDQPLRKLSARARAAFGYTVAGQLFAQLEPSHPTVAAPATGATTPSQPSVTQGSRKIHGATKDLPNCSCSTTDDYCAFEWGSGWYCLGGGCVWGTNWGCGSALKYPCNGLCDNFP